MGERGPQKQSREMACLGAKAPPMIGGSGLSPRLRYLDLLKRCLVNVLYQDPPLVTPWHRAAAFDLPVRLAGRDLPSQAHTMIGMHRLDHLQALIEDVLRRGVPGDLAECGAGRGGATIFMRGALAAFEVTDRTVWVADSFRGLPSGDSGGVTARSYRSPEFAAIADPAALAERAAAGTSLAEVRDHFARYGLLDERVRFVEGWFHETLSVAPISRLAVLRLDADLYDSTLTALSCLHPKVTPGGYVIVDDYHALVECRAAVHDYFAAAGIEPPVVAIDAEAVFWMK